MQAKALGHGNAALILLLELTQGMLCKLEQVPTTQAALQRKWPQSSTANALTMSSMECI